MVLAGVVVGSATAASIRGTRGNDLIRGTAKADVIHGLQGNDRIIGGAARSSVGGPGNDRVTGGAGNDRLMEVREVTSWTVEPGIDDAVADARDTVRNNCEIVSGLPDVVPPDDPEPAPTPPPTPPPTETAVTRRLQGCNQYRQPRVLHRHCRASRDRIPDQRHAPDVRGRRVRLRPSRLRNLCRAHRERRQLHDHLRRRRLRSAGSPATFSIRVTGRCWAASRQVRRRPPANSTPMGVTSVARPSYRRGLRR